MQAHIRSKAEGVLKRFEEMLPQQAAQLLSDEHRDELVLLVEAALNDVYVSTLHQVAVDLEKLAGDYRKVERVLSERL
jgi:FlaG/FlaF family flagellin (archaellin)